MKKLLQPKVESMDSRQIALKLVLDRMGLGTSIDSVEDRLERQKSVYLAQWLGVNLGYSYNWYHMGPYSPALTEDYYKLNSYPSQGMNYVNSVSLTPEAESHINRLVKLVNLCSMYACPRPYWLELLASLVFLIEEAGHTPQQASDFILQSKPHLTPYLAAGRNVLNINN